MKREYTYKSLILILLIATCQVNCYSTDSVSKYNVLFVSIDDLRPQLGCYGDTIVKSPNLDQFAKEALLFKRAYCQQALCSASRASILTGLRPETTGVTGMYMKGKPINEQCPIAYSLPENFKDQGYFTYSIGKVFHQMGASGIGSDNIESAWSEPAWNPLHVGAYGPDGMERYFQKYDSLKNVGADMEKISSIPKVVYWEAPVIEDDKLPDGAMAEKAIQIIRKCKQNQKNFFLAVGFVKPHLPFVAPKKYWDLYNPNELPLAPNDFHPVGAPGYTLLDNAGIYKYENGPEKGNRPTSEQELKAVHGYLACISYVDAQFQKLIDELKKQQLYNNTIIVVYGDHGFQIGEHDSWGIKHSNYEISTHAPLFIRIPDTKNMGHSTNALVEFIDIYPTLADYCQLPQPKKYQLEGISLRPLIENPSVKLKDAAFSVYPKSIQDIGRSLGLSMVTERYRLVRWSVPEKSYDQYELYDHQIDAQENFNLVKIPHYQKIVEEMKTKMHSYFNEHDYKINKINE